MRSFINKPGSTVTESLEGLALCYPDLIRVHYNPDFVQRASPGKRGKVAVISGSGSGHEPLPVGYVGEGMLDAACPGPLFTSPTPNQLIAATHAVESGGGVLFVVKNYAGGVLNAELSVETIELEGVQANSVIVNDDVSIAQPDNRRGLGAAILTMKIAGAAAEAGRPLSSVAEVARRTIANARSIGVATNTYTLPQAIHGESLTEDSVELGAGIHGEPGQPHEITYGVEEVADRLVQPILTDLSLQPGERVLLFISGMGGTPPLELYLLYKEVHHRVEQAGILIVRRLVGNYLTSLGRGGYLATILRLDEELTSLWDAPVRTPALRW